MGGLAYFVLGVCTALLVIHVVYVVWKKRIETTITRLLAPGVEVIRHGGEVLEGLMKAGEEYEAFNRESLERLVKIDKESNRSREEQVRAQQVEIGRLTSVNKQLTVSLKELQTILAEIQPLLRQFSHFAEVVKAIEENGVKVVTGTLPADVTERILVLAPKGSERGVWARIRKRIRGQDAEQ